MSRLIDADALDNAFTDLRWNGETIAHWGDRKDWCLHGNEIEELIQSQPTVDAVVHGHWEESNPQNSDTCRLIKCSKCGFSYIVGFNVPYEDWIEDRNYCVRCGAKMDEVTE